MATSQSYTKSQIQFTFGIVIPGRNWKTATTEGYGFGFKGKLKENDISGYGNVYDFGFRIYNPRIGSWLSIDTMQTTYAGLWPFTFGLNKPIRASDPFGRIVTYADIESLVAFDIIYNLNSPEFKSKIDALKSSYIQYHVTVNTTAWRSGLDNGQLGEVSYEFNENSLNIRVLIEVASELKFKYGASADELTGTSIT